MKRFADRGVREKLTLLVLLASGLALACVALAIVTYEATTFRPRALDQLTRSSELLENTLRPSLDFSDAESATRYLRAWRQSQPEAAGAAVFDRAGRPFASDHSAGLRTAIPVQPRPAGHAFGVNRLALWRPIERDGQVLGHLYVVEVLPSLFARLTQYGIMAGAVLLALLVVGGVLLGGVQRHFLGPLALLVKSTGRVANHNDFNVRAPVRQDELGELAQSFNQMIAVVGDRDAALREAARRIERVFEAVTDVAIISTNAEGTITLFNVGAERILGYGKAEVVGIATPMQFHLASEIEAYAAERSRLRGRPLAGFDALIDAAREGEHAAREWTFIRKDGTHRQLHLVVTNVRGAGGEISGFVGVAVDVSERRRAEAERARLEEQLRQAQKMEAVGGLAGGVAHDFNNMLTVILGHVELALLDVDPSTPLHHELLQVQRAAEKSADLTRQLLAFARKQTAAPQVLVLNDTVQGMLTMLGRLMGEDINLVWRPGPVAGEPWRVRIDPTQLDQVLANLCVNARDAITGVGRVTIETRQVTLGPAAADGRADGPAGDYVMLAVRDNGHGIPKEALEHIFEPFFTTKEIGEGTGLGLSTVFGIVKQNDGFVTVSSEPGEGASFEVYLPRIAGAPDTAPRGERATRPPQGLGETVLMVEDEPSILDLGQKILEPLGYTILPTRTPLDAIRQAESYPGSIDLLVSDVIMPEMNGQELAKRVAALRPGVKCLFVSGYTADVIAHRGVLDAGVQFLQKPFTVQDFARKVRETLDQRG